MGQDREGDKSLYFFELNNEKKIINLEQVKVKMYFRDSEGDKSVETTVWGLTRNDVILKESTIIPLNRILKVI